MNKIFLLLGLFLTVSLSQLNAQKIGVSGGVDFNQSSISFGDADVDKKVGFHIGAIYKQNLIGGFALTGELLYARKEFKLSSSTSGESGISFHCETHNLELPVNIRKSFSLPVVEPFIQLGPYASYALSGKFKGGDLSKSIDYDGGDRFDYGLNFGIGCGFPFNLQAVVNYGLGLKENKIPFGVSDDKVAVKNRQLSLSVAYLF
ncbi:MAG: porin family protein [Dysgonomonas sp.]